LDVVVQGKGLLDDSLQSKFTCFERPFPRKLPDGMDGSMANELLERASKTPRNNLCLAVLANLLLFFFESAIHFRSCQISFCLKMFAATWMIARS
jgi:hypothetical protein